jgi:hypothetical protein
MRSETVISAHEVELAVRAALDGLMLPAEVTNVAFSPGEDAAGEPSLNITISLVAGEFDQAAMQRITDTVYEIRRRVLALDFDRFPHFKLQQAA